MPQHLGAHPHNLHIVPEHRAPMWPQSRMPCILRHRLAGIIDHILLCFESRVWGGQSHTGKTAQQRIMSPYDATNVCCCCYVLEVNQSIAVNWRILPPPAGRGKKLTKYILAEWRVSKAKVDPGTKVSRSALLWDQSLQWSVLVKRDEGCLTQDAATAFRETWKQKGGEHLQKSHAQCRAAAPLQPPCCDNCDILVKFF